MAEKGFGVKEVNLIGASGTPTITSPNNLNLNANNVAISTNVSIGGTLSVAGNVSVGGTLTYEDVTNIDSVGLITARSGVTVSSGNVTTPSINLTNNGLNLTSSHDIAVSATGLYVNNTSNNATIASFQFSTGCQLRDTNGVVRLYTQTTGATVTGTLTATTFSGSGASLTNLPLPGVQVAYTVTANGASAYRFAGNGVVSTADNPDLYLIRGQKYRFINNSGGSHPFQIRESSGGTAYSTGVTNNGASSGNIDFAPTFDSPAKLVYQCTSHGGMVGNIYLRGAGGQNENVGVTTFSSNILTPQQVGCAVRMSTNISHPGNNSFNSGTSWVMPFDTEVWDIGSNFNTSNYTFTAPVAGRYLCCYTIQLETISSWVWNYIYPVVTGTGGTTNTVASAAAGIVFADDGGAGVTGGTNNTAAYRAFTNTVIINLNAGQEVRLGVRGDMTATIKGTTETQWTMQLLG